MSAVKRVNVSLVSLQNAPPGHPWNGSNAPVLEPVLTPSVWHTQDLLSSVFIQ